jgi:hypothetical protein
MTTLDKIVAASSDDANESGAGGVSLTNTTTNVDAADEWVGARWDLSDAPIPAGATIDVCTITCDVPNANFDEPDHPMYFQRAANPGTFTTGSGDLSGRSRTTATVSWVSAGLGAPGDFTSPDMKAVLQEVLDNEGELSAIVWLMQGNADGNRDMGITLYDGDTDLAPRLHVEYTAAGGGGVVAKQLAALGVG